MSIAIDELSQGLIEDRWYKDTLTFSFKTSMLSYESYYDFSGTTAVSTAMKNAVNNILGYIESILNIDFIYTSGVGNIVFSSKYMDRSTLGYSYMPGGTILNASGDIYINAYFTAQDFEIGGMGWSTILHEMGHSLGLDHPFGDGYYSGVDIYDTVMSYNSYIGTDDYGHYYNSSTFTTYQPADIYALQTIYGANTTTSDDTYILEDLLYASKLYGYIGTIDENLYTIYDYGGIDTISFDGYQTTIKQKIDINELQTSIVSNGLVYHYLTIAKDTVIENVVGSISNDDIVLNLASNQVDGGAGIDSVYITTNSGARIDKLAGKIVVSSPTSGFDVLTNTENLYLNSLKIDTASYARHLHSIDSPIADDIGRLYLAAFNRLPDAQGLEYFVGDYLKGQTIANIANSFVISSEFATLYGFSVTDADYIELLYNNVLNRSSDQEGYEYWQNDIANGQGYDDVLVSFANSQEFIDLTGVYFQSNGMYVS